MHISIRPRTSLKQVLSPSKKNRFDFAITCISLRLQHKYDGTLGVPCGLRPVASARFFPANSRGKKWGALRWSRVPHDYPAAPSGAPQGSRELCTTSGASRPGSVWCTKLPVRPPHGGIEYRTRGRRRTKTVHRTGPGRTPGPNRAPCGAPVHRTEPGSLPLGTFTVCMVCWWAPCDYTPPIFTGHRLG